MTMKTREIENETLDVFFLRVYVHDVSVSCLFICTRTIYKI